MMEDLGSVCREIAQECLSRLDQIANASDPSDHALQALLRSMAEDARLQAEIVLEIEGGRPVFLCGLAGDGAIQNFIRDAVPSLTKSFGEGILHRDIALFYAESLEEEASRLYRSLAEHAREGRTKDLLVDLSDRERRKLRFLREVVLQG